MLLLANKILLKSKILSHDSKLKTYRTLIRPVMTDCSETRTPRDRDEGRPPNGIYSDRSRNKTGHGELRRYS